MNWNTLTTERTKFLSAIMVITPGYTTEGFVFAAMTSGFIAHCRYIDLQSGGRRDDDCSFLCSRRRASGSWRVGCFDLGNLNIIILQEISMNRKITVIFIIAILAAGTLFAGTNSNKVAVLYHGSTQVNRNVLHFMGNQFYSVANKYKFYAALNPKNIKPGTFKAILVLNTGVRSGIDPKLAKFIGSWKNKSEIILISLYRGSNNLKVETIPASSNPQGVDTVSAASLWERGGLTSIFGKTKDPRQMHKEWVRQVLDFLAQKG